VVVRQLYGEDAVWIEREDGEARIVPASWTSLRPRATLHHADGRAVRLSPKAALALAAWVAARRAQE
jgi:hypothetical protein